MTIPSSSFWFKSDLASSSSFRFFILLSLCYFLHCNVLCTWCMCVVALLRPLVAVFWTCYVGQILMFGTTTNELSRHLLSQWPWHSVPCHSVSCHSGFVTVALSQLVLSRQPTVFPYHKVPEGRASFLHPQHTAPTVTRIVMHCSLRFTEKLCTMTKLLLSAWLACNCEETSRTC